MEDNRVIKQSIVAGMLIGFGVVINTLMQPPILGALLFSFGLLVIIHLKLPLYTGRVGFIHNKNPLISILFFNMLGILIIILLYTYLNKDFFSMITAAALNKFSKTYSQMFIGGILCGMLIHFAVKCKQPIITIGAIIIFILIGAEHCIADFPYFMFIAHQNFIFFFKFILVIIGNSLGAITIELLTGDNNG